MKLNKHPVLCLLFLLICGQSLAVHINPDGRGEVLLFPFYSVNNNLNTAYTLINTTDQAKVLKINFRESQAGLPVLTFNVYLAGYDTWTGVLGPTVADQAGHEGEPSVLHASGDASCAPMVRQAVTALNTSWLDQDLDEGNRSLARARTGYFEVLEMAELSGNAAFYASHDEAGVPNDCAALEAAWTDGNWQLDEPLAPGGGLLGSAYIVNVAQGVSFSYNALALNHFWGDEGLHTAPGEPLPDLSSGMQQATALLDSGEWIETEWPSGAAAVSATLMRSAIYNEYALDAIVNGQTDWVVTFPTKQHHVNPDASATMAPFTQLWDGLESCVEYDIELWDREAQFESIWFVSQKLTPRPPIVIPVLCAATQVLSLKLPDDPSPDEPFSRVLGAENPTWITSLAILHATENGWGRISFEREGQQLLTTTGLGFQGMPVMGFAVQQFYNGAAREGLLASYGSLFMHKDQITVVQPD